MNTYEIVETLNNAGFSVTVSADHETVFASLNRSIKLMEVEIALGFQVDRSRMYRTGNTVAIS